MRGAFIRTLTEVAARDERVFLLTGDVGYMALEPFVDRFPDRFINTGVAEQNMVGVATGLAEAGYIPFVYSIATFASLRPYEFIRNGPILHHLPVRIVGVGGGMEYGHHGPSHYALEDVGVMRVQPGLTILAPADHLQTETILNKTWNLPGPIYYRLGKDDLATVPGLNGAFELGRAQVICHGKDALLIAMGSVSLEAAAAIEALLSEGISSTLVIVASLNPAPIDDLVSILSQFPSAITVEAHYAVGGLGSLVSEIVAEHGISCRVHRQAVHAAHDGKTGGQSYLYNKYGLSRESLISKVMCQRG